MSKSSDYDKFDRFELAICLSHFDLGVIHRITEFLSRHPYVSTFDFWQSDGMCTIDEEDYKTMTGEAMPKDESWKKFAAGATPSSRLGNPLKAKILAVMAREVAEALRERFPTLKVSLSYYADLSQPCKEIAMPANVMPAMAMYWRCYKHPIYDKSCKYNRQYKQVITEVTEHFKGHDVLLGEYYMGMSCHVNLPYPIITTLFKEWPWLLEMGITAAKVHTGWIADTQPTSYNINYLAFQAIVWDDASSAEEFLEAYCKEFFDTAWQPLYEMYMLWEEGMQNAPDDTQPGYAFIGLVFDNKRIDRCRALLDQAMHETNDPKVLYRISRLIILIEYTRMSVRLTEHYYPMALKQRTGEPTEDLEKKLLPLLQPMADYARRLKELDQDIWGYPRYEEMMNEPFPVDGLTPWEQALARYRKKPGAEEAFDADILEAEVRKRAGRKS